MQAFRACSRYETPSNPTLPNRYKWSRLTDVDIRNTFVFPVLEPSAEIRAGQVFAVLIQNNEPCGAGDGTEQSPGLLRLPVFGTLSPAFWQFADADIGNTQSAACLAGTIKIPVEKVLFRTWFHLANAGECEAHKIPAG